MQVVSPGCCGIDVQQAQFTACLRHVRPEGQITTEQGKGGTTYQELLALSAWLAEHHCPIVALESTGVYTPVLSMATAGHCCACNQVRNASSAQ
jgi:hypothetical protein